MTRLRIAADGTVRGLWADGVNWAEIGQVRVERASHVEFCRRRQAWYVQPARPLAWWRRVLQALLGRPFGEKLFWAATRVEALRWEAEHFGPGGTGWPDAALLS
jgi:hypothetical protein